MRTQLAGSAGPSLFSSAESLRPWYACCLLMRSIVLSCGSTLPLYTLAYSSFSQEKLCGGESKGLFSTLSLQVSFS
ncbi:Solute carrier family 23 member 1 [Frankliniella fusca]|uniref:Solute carrier family 23 member 1 n=1 Tax=Frankliniella fusca TaxID=407009 RepID=A0AAE1LSZ8_9NEOP|nr:Solute carrier family 23 member 1 [Frankliniella fusca]